MTRHGRRKLCPTSDIVVNPLGFGCFGAATLNGLNDEEVRSAIDAVHYAFKNGINYFDVAPYYANTQSESILGMALRDIPRSEVVISSKIGRYGLNSFDYSGSRVESSVQESLSRLGISYLDLVIAHDVEFCDNTPLLSEETFPALRRIQSGGFASLVGVSGFPLATLDSMASHVDVILTYGHYNLFDTTASSYMQDWHQQGKGIISAAPLGMGLLSEREVPSWHPAPVPLREAISFFRKQKGSSLVPEALTFAWNAPHISASLLGLASTSDVDDMLKAWEEKDTILPAANTIHQQIMEKCPLPSDRMW
jgi:L-galactose dehydrogenase